MSDTDRRGPVQPSEPDLAPELAACACGGEPHRMVIGVLRRTRQVLCKPCAERQDAELLG